MERERGGRRQDTAHAAHAAQKHTHTHTHTRRSTRSSTRSSTPTRKRPVLSYLEAVELYDGVGLIKPQLDAAQVRLRHLVEGGGDCAYV